MQILKPTHKITGNELVRSIRPLTSMSQHCSDNFALSQLHLLWTDIREVFGAYWKNKTLGEANKYKDLEFCLVDEDEYFPNRKPVIKNTIKALGWE